MSSFFIKEQFKEFLLNKYGVKEDRDFLQMLLDPDSSLYQRCYDELTPEEQQESEDSDIFKAAMRRAFDKLVES